MKKTIGLLSLLLILVVCNASALEPEEDPARTVLAMLYERPDEVTLLDDEKTRQILSLQLSKDYTEDIYYTFEKALLVSGEASPFDRIVSVVYTMDEGNEPIIWSRSETEVGPSGLYQETATLAVTGRQYLLIGVTSEGKTSARLFTIERKSEDTLDELLDYRLNLYEEFGLS